jgi:secondary thiamine-phosphate synthase enzyme
MSSATFVVTVAAADRYAFVDLTDELCRSIKDSGVVTGCALAYCRHTTCGLLVNEWEDGALGDLRRRLQSLVPDDAAYAHDDFERRTQNTEPLERRNGRAYVSQMILGGTSQSVPVVAGEPVLGRWQRLFMFELDEPKPRDIVFYVFGE